MATAANYTGSKQRSALIQKAGAEMVQREAARRMALPGGSQPDFQPGPRKRYFDPE